MIPVRARQTSAIARSDVFASYRTRRGVVAVESAIVLTIVAICSIAALDLGMSVARSNSLSACARHAARYAMLRGSGAPSSLGPQEWSGTVQDDYPVAEVIRKRLLAMHPAAVQLNVSWPDSGNEQSDRVTVELSYQAPQLLAFMSEFSPLRARSTMRIIR